MIVKLNEFLDWTYHLDNVSYKLSGANFVLNKLKNLVPISVRKFIYESLGKAHLSYNILCWGRSNNSRMKIFLKCIRNLANKSYTSHTHPILHDLETLSFDDLFQLNSLTFMHKYNHRKLPLSLNNKFTPWQILTAL